MSIHPMAHEAWFAAEEAVSIGPESRPGSRPEWTTSHRKKCGDYQSTVVKEAWGSGAYLA